MTCSWTVRGALTLTTALLLVGAMLLPGAGAQETPLYLVPVGDDYTTRELLSVGDTVPRPKGGTYQMVGIPDGLEVMQKRDGTRVVWMNHEFRFDLLTQPLIDEPKVRGSFVSRLVVGPRGRVLTGDLAFQRTFIGDTPVGELATEANDDPAFGRFCSVSLPGKDVGFSRRILLTNEETSAPNTFDPLGASTVAVFNNEAHALPDLGHFDKENTLVMAGTGRRTVAISLEDGPNTPDSQVYLYVGRKDTSEGATVLERNGLVGGKLFVFASTTEGKTDESTFTEGSITGRWVEIPEAGTLSDVALEAAADAAGAFGFVRIEDGVFSPTVANEFFFVSTGGNPDVNNELGRGYRLVLDPDNPALGESTLEIFYNADTMMAAGEDVPLGPDNLDASADYLMISEGGSGRVKPLLPGLGRDLGVWRFPLYGTRHSRANVPARDFVAELNPPGRDGVEVPPGSWEPSGIVDASAVFGADTWLIDVQAHPPTTPPGVDTFQDGQLLIMEPTG